MIPYEELVIALQTWRAKQGLPVGQLSGALTPPPMMAAPIAPPMAPPQRTGPPLAPPKSGSTGPQQAFGGNVATPPPLAAPEESLDVDEGSLIEEEAQLDSEGEDFEQQFPAGRAALDDGESTAIGSAPAPRASESTLDDEPAPAADRNRNEDW